MWQGIKVQLLYERFVAETSYRCDRLCCNPRGADFSDRHSVSGMNYAVYFSFPVRRCSVLLLAVSFVAFRKIFLAGYFRLSLYQRIGAYDLEENKRLSKSGKFAEKSVQAARTVEKVFVSRYKLFVATTRLLVTQSFPRLFPGNLVRNEGRWTGSKCD